MNRRTFLGAISSAPLLASLSHPFFRSRVDGPTAFHPFTASMWTYLWDLVDEGYASALERMKENGLNSVSLACAYHAGKFLAPHNPKHKVVFLEDGTIYFEPTLSKYGRIRPKINSLVAEGHSLATVRKEAEKAGMQTRAWVVCCHNTPLGTEYPDISCRTAHGDPIIHNLCPSSPDVRHYLKALVSDIANQGASVIELEAMQFQGYTHGFHHEREGIVLPQTARFLLGLCFCSSCRQRFTGGGARFDNLQRYVRTILDTYFKDPDNPDIQIPSVDSMTAGELADLMEWRTLLVGSLAEELVGAVSGTEVRLRPLVSFDATARTMVGMNPRLVSQATGGVLMPGYTKDGETLRGVVAEMQSQIQEAELIVGFQVGLPESGGRAEFLSRVAAARELNIKSFNFYNYGFIPYEHLSWIRQALES